MAEPLKELNFTLILKNVDALTSEIEDALFGAGCDDATVSMQHGLLCMDFTRQASALDDAVLSAIRDVENAGIGAQVLRVDECGLVSQAEIARRINRTRQLIGQYISGQRGPGKFPAPEYGLDGKSQLWSWAEVSDWLVQNELLRVEESRNAAFIAALNRILENERQEALYPGLVDQISTSLSRARFGQKHPRRRVDRTSLARPSSGHDRPPPR